MSTNNKAAIKNIRDVKDIRPAPPSLELSSIDGSARPMLTLRKRQAAYQEDNAEKKKGLTMTAYNSAFLQDLFEDIAGADENGKDIVPPIAEELTDAAKETSQEQEAPSAATLVVRNDSATADPYVCTLAAISDYNLAKRRKVSTTKSLAGCGGSHDNLASFSHVSAAISKKGSFPSFMPTMTSTKKSITTQLDLPATVSVSYSSRQELEETAKTFAISDKTSSVHPQQDGDFGWYIDTDYGFDHDHALSSLRCDPYATTLTPLAFSAHVAPRSPTEVHQAGVEWASAADTVDEVLGDFF